MRRMVFTSVILAVGGLIGCQETKEEKAEPFVPMPPEMSTSVETMWKPVPPPTQAGTPAPSASSPAGKP